ncbi:DUF917 domain-containing protein [Nocardia sp. CDC159]|uniref:DUF917 domain-containing protein n=1 Tax=Nocardia pulmonis TaxID=2951408 RepID=A0A9X2IXP5_9NOCA|nr:MULTISPECIES: DUF917 domain-containing protein [Nocardia]MCM6774085.1 DUF917 domain-containing protein [Nocardia pulmonis]MCM6786972.1 DUF917 domain-containing protein [Nocardia sp. CDC159]
MIVDKLGAEDVDALQRGASLLGSGGGGDTHLSALWLGQELAGGAEVGLLDIDELEQGWVLGMCAFGSTASVAIEKLPAGDELRRCVATAEHQLGIDVDAIAVVEIGGSNALMPFIAAAQTGKPVVDGDLMGRAFSRLDQTVVAADELTGAWVTAEARGAAVIVDGVDARTAERVLRGALTGLGGWAVLAYPPISAQMYRRVALPGTVTDAIDLGRRHRSGVAAGDDGDALADRLGGDFLGQGTVLEVHRYDGEGFARGSVAVRTVDGRRVLRIEMQNEYSMVLRDGEVVATVPDVICLLDAHSLRPIQTGQVRRGHEVAIIVLPVPDRLWHPEVLPRLAPRAHGVDADPVRTHLNRRRRLML